MRRFFTIFAALFAFVGCSQDDVVTPNAPIEKPTYYASFADAEADSRTYLDENFMLLWHNDDRISLFATTYNEEYAFADATGSNSGAFNAVDKDSYVTGNAISTTYAVYPYNAANAISNSEILTIHFPAEQSYAEDSFGRGANTMVAAAQSSSSKLLPFRNAGGYMMLKLYGENKTVKSIELKGNNEEVISGAATAEAKYGYLPLITMGAEGGKSITLTCENAVELGATEAEATTFWIVVPPITFEEGFTITVTDADGGTYTKSTSKPTTINRNEIKSMSALAPTFTGETENPENTKPANNEIWYTSTDGNIVEPYDSTGFGANIISNTYENGKGIITFDGEITKIGNYAFSRCKSLTSIIIPNSVTSIGEYAFQYCNKNNLSITIPNSVTSIGEYAFRYCYGELIINSKIIETNYYEDDNPSNSWLTGAYFRRLIIGDSVTSIGDYAFSNCPYLTSVTIGNGVTSIGDYAFGNCPRLTSVTIGNSVTSIGYYAFSNCVSLQEFNGKFASTDHRCLIIDGVLTEIAPAELTEYTIPDSVTSIGDYAFYGCDSLTSVTIPDSVTSIGKSAFNGCTSLTSVTIGNSVTSIGSYAFWDCISLTSVTIPDSVTTIGYTAFNGCTSLTSVYCRPTTPPTVDFYIFDDNASELKIYVPMESLVMYKSATYWKGRLAHRIVGYDFENDKIAPPANNEIWYTATAKVEPYDKTVFGAKYQSNEWNSDTGEGIITFDDKVTSIGDKAFYDCISLTSITIPDSVTSIGEKAFYTCWWIESITIPDSVISLGFSAFAYCQKLTNVTIGNGLTMIGRSAFYGCSHLTTVNIPDSVTEIGYNVFAACSSLQEFSGKFASEDGRCLIIDGELNSFASAGLAEYAIPDNVTKIGESAFHDCQSLTSVIIGNSITTIGWGAFNNCDNLTSVTIGDNVVKIGEKAFNNCDTLTSVIIGDSITTIGPAAFWACTTLTSVYCKSTTPPSLDSLVFQYYDNNVGGCCNINCKIYVPTESVEAYKSASGWSEYKSYIVGYNF